MRVLQFSIQGEMLSTVCLLVALLGVVSVSADGPPLQIGNPNGLTVTMSSNSIIVTRQPTGQVISLAVASIRELDSNFREVVSTPVHVVNWPTGNGIHNPNPYNSTIPNSYPPISITCERAAIALYSISDKATLAVIVCGILNNGMVNFGNEIIEIARGQLGLSVQIDDWPRTATGKYLEVNFMVSVMTGRTMSAKTGVPVTLELGTTDSYARLSTKATNPEYSTFDAMPTGYPMITQSNPVNNKVNIVAMLPVQVGARPPVWNAIIEPGYQPPGPVSAAESVFASWMIHAITAALACLTGSFDRRQ